MIRVDCAAPCSLYVGDCLDVVTKLEQKFDAIVFDPPYNIGVDYDEHHDSMPKEQFLDFLCVRTAKFREVLSDRGSMWIVINAEHVSELDMFCKHKLNLHPRRHIVWHYRFGENIESNFISSKAHILYYAADRRNIIWHGDQILEPSDRAAVYRDKRTQNKKAGKAGLRVPFDVWQGDGFCRVQGNNRERRPLHKNQLPEMMLFRILRCCTEPDSKVLDPFVGSGTTCVVAASMGLESVGIDISKEYIASAAERIKAGPVRSPDVL